MSSWHIPLCAFQANARGYATHLISMGVYVTFRGALRIYRQARDGTVYVRPGTLEPFS